MSVSWIDPAKQRIMRPPASYTAFLPGWSRGIPSRGINTESPSLLLHLSWPQYTLLPACALSIKVWDEERMSRCPQARSSVPSTTFCGQDFLDIQDQTLYTFTLTKKNFLSIEFRAVGCWKFELSFLLRKANAMRSDWNDERQDTDVLACLNGFVPNRLFCKSCYDCMSI